MNPPAGTRVLPVSTNNGSHDQLPSSSNNGNVGASADSHGRNNYFVDGVRGSFKRKNAEGILGNFHYCNASAGTSSAVILMNASPPESDVTLMDAASFPHPDYRGTDSGAVGLDSMLVHNNNHLIQGIYLGRPFQAAGIPWLDQQFINGVHGGTLTWNHLPASPYPPGSIGGNCMEVGNMCIQGYQVIPNNRSSISFLHPPFHRSHLNLYHPPLPPMQGVRGQNIDFHSQVAASSRRVTRSSTSHANVNSFRDGMEVGPRDLGSFPQTGLRIYRPHRREVMLEATPRQHNLPHLRVLPEDGVAVLEIPGYHEVRDPIDHHRDMRLDIDHMSYEELLALGEQIGNAGTGLSEEKILCHLKTSTFFLSTICSNVEDAVCGDQENDFCVICQAEYKDEEKIGTLDCWHEYHVDCIKKWLLVKNSCPICKSLALNAERKDL